MSMPVQRTSWVTVGVGACAIVLAAAHAIGIQHQSFWIDEAATVFRTDVGSLTGLLGRITGTGATDRLQPGYLVAAWLWLRVFGWEFESLRWMSLGFFWLAMFLAWRLLKDRGLNREAGCLALLLGVSPFWWFLAQEARSYTMALAFVLLALWLEERQRPYAIVQKGWSVFVNQLLVALAVFLATAANFYAILVWPVIVASDFIRSPRVSWRYALIKHGMIACLGMPLFLNFANLRALGIPGPGTTREFALLTMAGLGHMLALGTSWGASIEELRMVGRSMDAIATHWPWYVISVVSLLLALWGVLRLRAWRALIPETILAGLSLGSIVWLSFRHGYAAAPRHLFLMTPAVLGWGAVVLARRPAWILPFVACCVVSSAQYLLDPAYAREDWRGALEAIRSAPGYSPASRIAFTQNGRFVFDLYLTHSIPGRSPRAEHMRGLSSPPVNCAVWVDPVPPDFLVEARSWEASSGGRQTLDRLKARMVVLYRARGITVWRKPPARGVLGPSNSGP